MLEGSKISKISVGKFKIYAILNLKEDHMYINKQLLGQKNSNNHKPLILRGVKQCCKTSVIRKNLTVTSK